MTVLERRDTGRGELVLRRVGGAYEIISNGVFLMDSRSGASERLLVTEALARCPDPGRVLVGGLGMGFSLEAALSDERVRQVTVLEIEPAVIEWHHGPLTEISHGAVDDARVELVCADLVRWLPHTARRYDVICLDIDNGPHWTVREANGDLYGPAGLDAAWQHVRAGGVLAVWSAASDPDFADLLGDVCGPVEQVQVPVPRGEPDVVYLAADA